MEDSVEMAIPVYTKSLPRTSDRKPNVKAPRAERGATVQKVRPGVSEQTALKGQPGRTIGDVEATPAGASNVATGSAPQTREALERQLKPFLAMISSGQQSMREGANLDVHIRTLDTKSINEETLDFRLVRVLGSNPGFAAATELALMAIRTGAITAPDLGWRAIAESEAVQDAMRPDISTPFMGEQAQRMKEAQEETHQRFLEATLSYLAKGKTNSDVGKRLNPANSTPEQRRQIFATPEVQAVLTKAMATIGPKIL